MKQKDDRNKKKTSKREEISREDGIALRLEVPEDDEDGVVGRRRTDVAVQQRRLPHGHFDVAHRDDTFTHTHTHTHPHPHIHPRTQRENNQ